MDWTWFLFSFEGRISRGKIWFAALIWFATVFSFMTLFLFVVAGILWATGHELHAVSTSTMHPAFYLLGSPLFIIAVWLFAATAIKRLHDRDKSGWWFAVFFIAPGLLNRLWDWLDNPLLAFAVDTLGFGLSVWCFVEMFCLRGAKGPNRFGSDPLAPVDTRPPWEQQSEIEIVPQSAGPSLGAHVKRGA
jgi:uncharacterized membrane protein YhaH (DUF805 family)